MSGLIDHTELQQGGHQIQQSRAAQADAVRILIPMNRCGNLIAGIRTANTSEFITDTIEKLSEIIGGRRA